MQRPQAPPQLLQANQQACKRQASFGVSDQIPDKNTPYINPNSSNPHYMENELKTVGMRIRQRVDQGYSLLNREASDLVLSQASLNNETNVKNYAGLIVPQFNPVSPSLESQPQFQNTNNNTPSPVTQQEAECDDNEEIASNGKRRR